jgi:hypothetical protein
MFGSGQIAAFNPVNGSFIGLMKKPDNSFCWPQDERFAGKIPHHPVQALDANGTSALVVRAVVGVGNLRPLARLAFVSKMNSNNVSKLRSRGQRLGGRPIPLSGSRPSATITSWRIDSVRLKHRSDEA